MRLTAIDGASYIYRAFYALPQIERSDGQQTGAVYGFCSMLWRRLKNDQPTHIGVVFDAPGKKFRHSLYDQYKANRPELPEDLTSQFALIREAVDAFNVPRIEVEGYEADDVIAAATTRFIEQGGAATVVSSDKDFYQLLCHEGIEQWCPIKGRPIDRDDVVKKLGVGPDLAIDAQALIGDSADNVPGVPGIGPKTVTALFDRYGDLESLLWDAESVAHSGIRSAAKISAALLDHAEQARLSKELVTLSQEVPGLDLEHFTARPLDPDQLLAFLDQMEFVTLKQDILADLRMAA